MREWDSLPKEWQQEYCYIVDEKHFGIDERLKYNITFMKHNLMEEFPQEKKFDLILCRNVMIYFDKASRRKLISSLERHLKPGGYLLIGHSELLSAEESSLKTVPVSYTHLDVYKRQYLSLLEGQILRGGVSCPGSGGYQEDWRGYRGH